MTPILIMELRGFSQLASDLARELDRIDITPERVRASGIEFVRRYIQLAKSRATPTQEMHLGGDTWYWNFHSTQEAIQFGLSLLGMMKQGAIENGLFYLKPSMALGYGEPRFDGERFLDDSSIQAYKVADGGKSFAFFVVGDALQQVAALGLPLKVSAKYEDHNSVKELTWLELDAFESTNIAIGAALPSLLLDSEIIYSNSYSEAINNIVRQQENSATALVFGGPGSLSDPLFKSYVSKTISLLRSDKDIRFSVLSYLPIDEPLSSFIWLELCRSIQTEFPGKFAFSAFSIAKGQLRPFSYHVYDGKVVHIGLRSYSPQRGTPTLSSAIMLRNKKISERFEADFLENFRGINILNDARYAKLVRSFSSISSTERSSAMRLIRQLISGKED